MHAGMHCKVELDGRRFADELSRNHAPSHEFVQHGESSSGRHHQTNYVGPSLSVKALHIPAAKCVVHSVLKPQQQSADWPHNYSWTTVGAVLVDVVAVQLFVELVLVTRHAVWAMQGKEQKLRPIRYSFRALRAHHSKSAMAIPAAVVRGKLHLLLTIWIHCDSPQLRKPQNDMT